MNDGLSGVTGAAQTSAARTRFEGLDMDNLAERLRALGEVDFRRDADPPYVSVRRDGKQEGLPTDRDQWPALMAWMASAIEEFWPTVGAEDAIVPQQAERDP